MLPGYRAKEKPSVFSSTPFPCTIPTEFLFLFSFKCHLIISGILTAKRSEWDAEPVMTNVGAKVTERQSQGTWDGGAMEASCGLVIMGLRSVRTNKTLSRCHNNLTAQGQEDT